MRRYTQSGSDYMVEHGEGNWVWHNEARNELDAAAQYANEAAIRHQSELDAVAKKLIAERDVARSRGDAWRASAREARAQRDELKDQVDGLTKMLDAACAKVIELETKNESLDIANAALLGKLEGSRANVANLERKFKLAGMAYMIDETAIIDPSNTPLGKAALRIAELEKQVSDLNYQLVFMGGGCTPMPERVYRPGHFQKIAELEKQRAVLLRALEHLRGQYSYPSNGGICKHSNHLPCVLCDAELLTLARAEAQQ